MDNIFSLDIVTAQAGLEHLQAVSLVVPAEYGYMGVLAHHAPMAARLVKGIITFKDKDNRIKQINNESGGFMQVSENNVTIMLEENF